MTIEYGDLNQKEKKLYFPIDNITETCYVNIVSDEEMKNNKNLLKMFKEKIIEDRDKKITSSFTVFKSEYDQSFYYAIHFTHFLQ